MYKALAKSYGLVWKGRRYDPKNWAQSDLPNACLSAATACLYGVSEAAILAAGYAPAIGFLHRGKPQSFVYDIADIFKFETVVPTAFATAAKIQAGKIHDSPERAVRIACRNAFRDRNILARLIPAIHDVLAAGGLEPPVEAPEALDPAIPAEAPSGDEGHRG